MGQALYRKYRSKSLGEIVGQEHITTTLDKAIKAGKISHAYLFTGPRGTGKTSVARILAHQINDLPYTDDSTHLDIIEIDAASNRRIDEIRELRDKVHIAPAAAKYKVYIIDEVHMLTREAFNALLKTLEEPPAHAVFILATTEAHKLPETIISRTQRFSFKPVASEQVISHLRTIADGEKIKIDDQALTYIASIGQGSFRDSISLLDQAGSTGSAVNLKVVQALLGVAPETAIDELLDSLRQGSALSEVLGQLSALYDQCYQPAQISHQLTGRLRQSLIENQPILGTATTVELLDKLIEVPASHSPERALEVALLQTTTQPEPGLTKPPAIAAQPAATKTATTTISSSKSKKPAAPGPSKAPSTKAPVKVAEQAADIVEAPAAADLKPLDPQVWNQVLDTVKSKYYTLYSVLKTARPQFAEDSVELVFAFAFHQRRINEAKNRAIVADTFKKLTGKNVQIICSLGAATPATAPAPEISTISNIFGGGELLES